VLCLQGANFRSKRKTAKRHYIRSGYISETLKAGISLQLNL